MNSYLILKNTIVGDLTLVANEHSLIAVLWETDKPLRDKLSPMKEDRAHPVLTQTKQQLQEFFSGQRKKFQLPLEFKGTEFQLKVWKALAKIPFGKTCSYQDIANSVGSSKAVRAVGAANGRNPLSIVIPCHRVIGKSGKLVGFAAGLDAKQRLLEFEKNQV